MMNSSNASSGHKSRFWRSNVQRLFTNTWFTHSRIEFNGGLKDELDFLLGPMLSISALNSALNLLLLLNPISFGLWYLANHMLSNSWCILSAVGAFLSAAHLNLPAAGSIIVSMWRLKVAFLHQVPRRRQYFLVFGSHKSTFTFFHMVSSAIFAGIWPYFFCSRLEGWQSQQILQNSLITFSIMAQTNNDRIDFLIRSIPRWQSN